MRTPVTPPSSDAAPTSSNARGGAEVTAASTAPIATERRPAPDPVRRRLLAAGGAALVAGPLAALRPGHLHGASDAPLRFGFQAHRTGIGATYGRWYERVANAAVAYVNETGGIGGRPVELVVEDDGTDPKRGAEVVEKFATRHDVELVFGPLFSNVVIASAARAGNLEMPYFVCSEGHHVASGLLNRWTVQPGITDVKSQVIAMAPWVSENLGKKVTMFIPDYAFGYDHRDNFTEAMAAAGGEVLEVVAIPPTESSFTKYMPRIARGTEVVYHVMVGPAVLTFVKEMGEFFGRNRPEIFGFIDSLEGVDLASPGLESLVGSHFWEGMPRYAFGSEHDAFYRERVGVDERGASVDDPADVSTYGHMFSVWETLMTIRRGMQEAGYADKGDRRALIEAFESFETFPEGDEHPQGEKRFNGRTHQAFGRQFITRLDEAADGPRLEVVHTTSIEDGMYPDEVDYTKTEF